MKSSMKNTIILTVITLISGLLLGSIYQMTKEPIAAQNELAKQKAYKAVMSEAAAFEDIETDFDVQKEILTAAGLAQQDVIGVVKALDEKGGLCGYVISVSSHEGYGGDIDISVGIDMTGCVKGVEILSISETAGLGMRANTPEFKNQFADKNVEKFVYTKTGKSADNEIDALSGATITSRTMTNGVNAALVFYKSLGGDK